MINKSPHQINNIIQNRYHLLEVLGSGGVGITYRAYDLLQEQSVAIKVVSLKQMKEWKVLELLDREAKVLQSIEHPAIPRYLDSFEIDTPDNRTFYLIQELAPGRSLSQWVAQGWRATEAEAQSIAQQLLKILIYLQSLNPAIIHRDLKPQNIIRDRDGNLFLVDFGAVQDTFRHTVTGGSTVVGTFGYMAPEQFRGQATLSTDLYGLGTTLLFLLTGIDPADLSADQMQINFRPHVQLSRNVAAWLEGLIKPAIEERIPNAQVALSILQGEEIFTHHTVAETIRYRRVTIERREDCLKIQIQPAGLRRERIRWVGLICLVYLVISSLWFWWLSAISSIEVHWANFIMFFMTLLSTTISCDIFYLFLLGAFLPTQIVITKPQSFTIERYGSLIPFIPPQLKCKNNRIWLPFWGWQSFCWRIYKVPGSRSATFQQQGKYNFRLRRGCGFLLDNTELELVQNHFEAFQAEIDSAFRNSEIGANWMMEELSDEIR